MKSLKITIWLILLNLYLLPAFCQLSISGNNGVCPSSKEIYKIDGVLCCKGNPTYNWYLDKNSFSEISSLNGLSFITVLWSAAIGAETLSVDVTCDSCIPKTTKYQMDILDRIPGIFLSTPTSGEVSFDCGTSGSKRNYVDASFMVTDKTSINVVAPSGWTYEESISTALTGGFILKFFKLWPTNAYTVDSKFEFSVKDCYDDNSITVNINATRSFPSKEFNNQTLPSSVSSSDYIKVTNCTVPTTSAVTLLAKNYIELNYNFSTVNGENFIAEIGEPICGSGLKSTAFESKINNIGLSDDSSKVNAKYTLIRSQIFQEERLMVYPNPNTGSFKVSLTDDGISEIVILNMFGQAIQFNAINNVGSSIDITLPNGSKGMYLVKLKGKQKTYVQKIVVE